MAVARRLAWMLGLLVVAAGELTTGTSAAEADTKGSQVTTQEFGKIAEGNRAPSCSRSPTRTASF